MLLEAKGFWGTQYRKVKENIPIGFEQEILMRFMSWASKFKTRHATLPRFPPKVNQRTSSPSGWYLGYQWPLPGCISDSLHMPRQQTGYHENRFVASGIYIDLLVGKHAA